MLPVGKATSKVKSEHFSDDEDSLQKQIRIAVKQAIQVRQQGLESKGQRRPGKVRLGRERHATGPARPRDRARQFP